MEVGALICFILSALVPWGGGGIACAALFWGFSVFLLGALSADSLSAGTMIAISLTIGAIPCAIFLGTRILEQSVSGDLRLKGLSIFTVTLGLTYLFSTGTYVDLLEACAVLPQRLYDSGAVFIFVTRLLTGLVFSVSTMVAVGLLLALALELPLRWILGAKRVPVTFDFRPLRLLVILGSFMITAQLVGGLFLSELGPKKLLSFAAGV